MNEDHMKKLIGKEVWIYPGDHNKKRGIILAMNENGLLFKITYYNGNDEQYQVGKLHWISFSARLTFSEY